MAKSSKRSQKEDADILPIEEKSEFINLANIMKVKLNDKRPFRKVESLNNIGVEAFKLRPSVIVGMCLYERLDSKERLAIMAHEFAHLKMHHGLVRAGSIFMSVIIVLLTVPNGSCVSSIMIIMALFIGFWVASYFSEYWADTVAVQYTNDKDSFISALRKLESPERWTVDYESHPSISHRVAKLSKI